MGQTGVRRERINRNFKLRLLAFVLALLLLWYSLNPAPYRVVRRRKASDDEPDAKRREARQAPNPTALSFKSHSLRSLPIIEAQPSVEEEDDFEWPEFIDG